MTTKIDNLEVSSMTITSLNNMIIPTATLGDNSLKASSIGFMTNEIGAMDLTQKAQLAVSNTWNSITSTSYIIGNSFTKNPTLNICMNNSNILCNPTVTNLTINNTLTSLSSVFSKMATSSTRSKIIRGTATMVGGTVTVIYGITFSTDPTVLATPVGTSISINNTAYAVYNQTTTQVSFTSSTNLTMTLYYLIFG